MALFVGEFDQSLDDKRRLAIPAALREQIDPAADGTGFFLVLGLERHLWLYPDGYYRRLAATLKRSPLPTRRGQKLGMFWAMARHLRPDAQGRVVLPAKSLQRAVVGTDLTLVGHDDRIELWPRKEWDTSVDDRMPTYDDTLLEVGEELAARLPEPPPSS